MDTDRSVLFDLIRNNFSKEEATDLANRLGVDFNQLQSASFFGKIAELIAFLERQDKLNLLADEIHRMWPNKIESNLRSSIGSGFRETDQQVEVNAKELSIELANLRQQLQDLQKETSYNGNLDQKFREILETAKRAINHSEELTARVILPEPDEMNVRLVPSQSLERLEEYRSDENIAYLLIGTFGGSILGIISNWATSEMFTITRFSVVLISVLIIMILLNVLWAQRINKRASLIKEKIFNVRAN